MFSFLSALIFHDIECVCDRFGSIFSVKLLIGNTFRTHKFDHADTQSIRQRFDRIDIRKAAPFPTVKQPYPSHEVYRQADFASDSSLCVFRRSRRPFSLHPYLMHLLLERSYQKISISLCQKQPMLRLPAVKTHSTSRLPAFFTLRTPILPEKGKC